jgi:hypothetical protein
MILDLDFFDALNKHSIHVPFEISFDHSMLNDNLNDRFNNIPKHHIDKQYSIKSIDYTSVEKILLEKGFEISDKDIDYIDFYSSKCCAYDEYIRVILVDDNIDSIHFNIDKGINYKHECGVFLDTKDLKMFSYFLNIFIDNKYYTEYLSNWFKKYLEFLAKVNRFSEILNQYYPIIDKPQTNLSAIVSILYMYEDTRSPFNGSVLFEFNYFDDTSKIEFNMAPKKNSELNLDCSIEEFEEEFKKQVKDMIDFETWLVNKLKSKIV